MTIISGDDKQYIPDGKLKPFDETGREQYQPIVGEWNEIVEPATADANGLITFTNANFDAEAAFVIGDRIRLKQGGGFKYFYVIVRSNNTITVDAGTTYTTIAAAVTNLAILSRFITTDHVEFPAFFTYTPIITASGAMTIGAPSTNLKYTIMGGWIKIAGILAFTLGGVASNVIYVSFPFLLISAGTLDRPLIYLTNGAATPANRIGWIAQSGFDNLAIEKIEGTNWNLVYTVLYPHFMQLL